MELDKNMLSRLLTLDDASLLQAITLIAKESGIDPSKLGISNVDTKKLRAALENADDEDIRRATELLKRKNDMR